MTVLNVTLYLLVGYVVALALLYTPDPEPDSGAILALPFLVVAWPLALLLAALFRGGHK